MLWPPQVSPDLMSFLVWPLVQSSRLEIITIYMDENQLDLLLHTYTDRHRKISEHFRVLVTHDGVHARVHRRMTIETAYTYSIQRAPTPSARWPRPPHLELGLTVRLAKTFKTSMFGRPPGEYVPRMCINFVNIPQIHTK